MALGEKQPIREISRRTGLSRNTIAKYLSAGTIEPTFTDLNSVAAVIVLPTDRHKV
jgi:transcriptional regulator with XRE-family HTH domain